MFTFQKGDWRVSNSRHPQSQCSALPLSYNRHVVRCYEAANGCDEVAEISSLWEPAPLRGAPCYVRNILTARCRFAATCISTYGLQLRKKMGAYLLLTCIAIPFVAVISLFFIQETRRALDVALGFSLLTFLSSVGL